MKIDCASMSMKIISVRLLVLRVLTAILCVATWGGSLGDVPQAMQSASVSKRIALGRRLFFDAQLSADGTISCASCHKEDSAFSDGRPVALGVRRLAGVRNAPSLLHVAHNAELFWDGRAASLEEQALQPFFNPREHGLVNEAQLLSIINADRNYRAEFQAAFALGRPEIQATHVAQAIAEFERTLTGAASDYDRQRLSTSAQRGLQLFAGRAQCSDCHQIGGEHPTFSDGRFHARGIGLTTIMASLPELTAAVETNRKAGGTVDTLLAQRPDVSQLGRYLATNSPRDIGAWRTPSLRNVAITAPYMHDGSIASLEEAVDHELYMNSGQPGRRIVLTPGERDDLVNFLRSLTSSSLRNIAASAEQPQGRTGDSTPPR